MDGEPRRTFVPTDELVEAFRTAPPIDPARFRADVDALVSQEIRHPDLDPGSDRV